MTTGTEADKPSDQAGSSRGDVILSGQIADELTMRKVLEQITQSQSVENGILRILSKEVRGNIGIQKGMHLTGAQVTSTGDRGRAALIKLLSADKGLYAFISLPEKQPELQQSFNLTIGELLNWHSLGFVTDRPPALTEAIESMLSHEAATINESEAMSAEQAASSQLVQDTEAQFETYLAWGGDIKPSGGLSGLNTILGKNQTTEQTVPVEQIPMPADDQSGNGQGYETPTQPVQAAPPVPPIELPPPPPPGYGQSRTAEQPRPQTPEMPPPPPPGYGKNKSEGYASDFSEQPMQMPEMPPPPPPGYGKQRSQGDPQSGQPEPRPSLGGMVRSTWQGLKKLSAAGNRPPEANAPAPPPAAGTPPAPPPAAGLQVGVPHNQSTSGRWTRAQLGTDERLLPDEPVAPVKPSQQLRGLQTSTPGQPVSAPAPQATGQNKKPAETERQAQQQRAMEQRTSERMKLMGTAQVEPAVPAVQEAKSISKDVIIGGAIGVGLLLLLASQSFQALAYKGHFQDGVAALKAGKNDVAVVEFSSSISANPGDSRVYLLRALAEARMNNHKAALEDYNKVLALDPNNLKAMVARATLYNRTKQYDAAIMDCDKAISVDKGFLDAYRVRALAYNQSGRYSESLADSNFFMEASKTSADKVSNRELSEVCANRAYANFNKKEYDAAIADYTEAINAEPENGQLYASRAVVYKQVHDWKRAMDDSNKAISLLPGDTSLFKIRGVVFAGLGDAQKAADDLNNLVKYNPSVENHRMRGQARLEIHDFQGALEDFDFVLGAKPHDQDARAKYQAARLGLQGTAKTTSMIADAVPLKHEPINLKQPEPALVKRGYELMLSGNAEDAQQYLAEAVKRTPNDASARRYLAYTLIEANENELAIEQFSALSKMQSLPPGDMLMFAKALKDSKHEDQAQQVYRNILTADQTNDRARTELIKTLEAAGDKDQAIKLAQEGIQASPNSKDSYQQMIKDMQDKDKKDKK